MSANLPSGTITLLFTDIEGSTKLAQQYPERWESLRARHHTILRSAIECQNGYVFQIIGDAFCAAFHTAGEALQTALRSQVSLYKEGWGDTPVKVRMGIHTGKAEIQADGDYSGYVTLCRVQRLMSAGHGGQTLISQTTQDLVYDELLQGITLHDLGEHRLKDLARPEHIFQLIIPDLPNDFPPIKTLDTLANNLPVQLTSFIGREKEIAEVKCLLHENRLVTITGPGGTGKTRLSLQTAADLLEVFPNGVWLVELAPLADPALVPQAVASALGVREQQGRPLQDTLTDYLREKKLLLILDNCEHLVEACAALADALLHACPGLKILASSREALGISGEVPYRLPSLSTPDTRRLPPTEKVLQYEAVRLFTERAVTALPSFNITNENAPALAQVCRRLDGIPLAIELAAARVRMLSVEQIAARLDDCFRLLTGGSRTALPRLQTLQALIDWSYDLLSDSERSLLCRLSVFAGGWTLEAAEAVCAQDCSGTDVLDLLTQLVNKSLVVVDYAEGQQTRYHLLETVRQYALQKLAKTGEGPQVRTRHLAHFLQLAEEAEPHLYRHEQLEWLARLEQEHDNLRAAFEWAMDGVADDTMTPPEAGLRLANALSRFWTFGDNRQEGHEALGRALANPGQPVHSVARAWALANISYYEDNREQAARFLEQSLALCRELGDKPALAYALMANAARTRQPSSRILLEESQSLFREQENLWGVAVTFEIFGQIANYCENNFTEATQLTKKSLDLARRSGDRRCTAHALGRLGDLAWDRGDLLESRACFEESLFLARELGSKTDQAYDLDNLGQIALGLTDFPKAEQLLHEGLEIAREGGFKGNILSSLFSLGQLARFQGDYTLASDLFTQSLSMSREISNQWSIAFLSASLGEVARLQGDLGAARTLYTAALGGVGDLNERRLMLPLIEGVASLSNAEGELERSATLFGTAQALRKAIPFILTPVEQKELDRSIALLREKMGEAAFEAAWTAGQALTYDQAVDLVTEVLKASGDQNFVVMLSA